MFPSIRIKLSQLILGEICSADSLTAKVGQTLHVLEPFSLWTLDMYINNLYSELLWLHCYFREANQILI